MVVEQLDETDPELLIRNVGTVLAVAAHLLHSEAIDPVLADAHQAWSRGPAAAVRRRDGERARRGGELGQR